MTAALQNDACRTSATPNMNALLLVGRTAFPRHELQAQHPQAKLCKPARGSRQYKYETFCKHQHREVTQSCQREKRVAAPLGRDSQAVAKSRNPAEQQTGM